MSEASVLVRRLATGIPGLDSILEGGLLEGGVYVLQGPPGAGKTIFGNQLCFAYARRGGKAVYITLLAESHTRMLDHLRRMRFFDSSAIPNGIYYVSAFKVLEGEGLDGLLTLVRKTLTAHAAKVLVLDGLVSAEEASQSAREYKKFIHELQTVAAMLGCTVLLLSSTERPAPFRPEHTMVDGIIELSDELADLRQLRHVRVRKMRGADPVRGKHSLEISDDGIRVRPRIETLLETVDLYTGEGGRTDRLPFGIDKLDEMLRGGLPRRSLTMLLGPTGAGKTLLGMQFLAEGARRGEPGVLFGFYERPDVLLEKSRRLGLGLEQGQAEGLVDIVWQRPVEGVVDVLGERLLDAVRRRKAQRLFLDGMHGFRVAIESLPRVRDVYSALSDALRRAGVTTVYSLETLDLHAPAIQVPYQGVSAFTHNMLLLRLCEFEAQLRRTISIFKLRDSDYDPTIREFRITDHGFELLDTFQGASSILTGVGAVRESRANVPRPKRPKRAPAKTRATSGKHSRKRKRNGRTR